MNRKTVVLNSGRMNYDGNLDLSILSDDLVVYESSEQSEILDRVAGFEIVVTKELPLTAETIEKFPPEVKIICEAGTGFNNINLEAVRKKGIMVCNIPAYSTERVAHTAIMLMLNLSSSMQMQQKMLCKGDRSNFTKYMQLPHVELNGKVLGVIGYGNIGKGTIKVAKALDMEILVYTRTKREDEDGVKFVTLDELFAKSDYVSLHCPLSDATKHIINKETIEKMKPTAFVINTSRGPLIDEVALIEALKAGRIAGAGLDVQEVEPPADDNPLYDMDNVILTPHMGWKGLETRRRLISILAGNIKAYDEGKPINVVS